MSMRSICRIYDVINCLEMSEQKRTPRDKLEFVKINLIKQHIVIFHCSTFTSFFKFLDFIISSYETVNEVDYSFEL